MGLQAILWDNDGVLVDTERIFFETNREFFRDLSIEFAELATRSTVKRYASESGNEPTAHGLFGKARFVIWAWLGRSPSFCMRTKGSALTA